MSEPASDNPSTSKGAPVALLPAGTSRRFDIKVVAVWVTLLALFVLFFLSFNLKFSIIVEKFPYLAGLTLTRDGFIQGAALTLFVCFFSIVASSCLGLASALGRLSRNPVLYGVSTFYTSFFRGTPLLVQIFLIYLGLPQLGPVPGAIPAGITALSLNYGAYLSEIFRSGIISVPKGQHEASSALGLPARVIMWKIVLPQALIVALRPYGNEFILMIKGSAIVALITVPDLMGATRLAYSRSYDFQAYIWAAIIYLLIVETLRHGIDWIERGITRHLKR